MRQCISTSGKFSDWRRNFKEFYENLRNQLKRTPTYSVRHYDYRHKVYRNNCPRNIKKN